MYALVIRIRGADDAALTEAIRRGDGEAAGELFRRHRDAMHACACSVLRDPHDADDAVQTAMTKALEAIPRDRPRRLRPWLLAIARNEALMLLRSRVPGEVLRDDHPSAVTVEGAFAVREETAGLVVDLRGLPDRQRSAIVLRHLYELSYRDIGELLGVRPATARQAVLQARRSLLARAEARAQDCGEIRLLLADGRARRAIAVRAHLENCAACRAAVPSGIAARIRGLLPVPEPMLPPIVLRLLSGPGTGIRTGGAAAACVCTLVIGLGLVEQARRGDAGASTGPGHTVAPAPDREDRFLTAGRHRDRAGRTPRGAARGPAKAPSAGRAPVTRRSASPAQPAAPAQPARPAAAKDPQLQLVDAPPERYHHVTVELVDSYSVTVSGWDLEKLPIIGEPPVEPPVDPPMTEPDPLPLP